MIKILWADDQQELSSSITRIIESNDMQIDLASDGEEALAKILSETYDLVLVDLAMPPGKWGGLWLLQELKSAKNEISTIVVSGEGTQSETIKAIRLGASDYVTKEQLTAELPQQIMLALHDEAKKQKKASSIIKNGETDSVEFKSTLRVNLRTNDKDRDMELSVLKTLAGFLNASGGSLLIGVTDECNIIGIETDKFPNTDKFQLHFWNIFRESIGIEFGEFVKTEIIRFEDKHIFLVNCLASNRPVYLKWKQSGQQRPEDLFFVRVGPQTDLLSIRQAITYIGDHFKN